jgi:predicted  nucleic acid-binding Zn-ribbon protein
VKADPFVQLKLLDLQELDSAAHRLQVRRAGLPAHAAISEADAALAEARSELVTHQTAISDEGRAAAKLESDIEQVRARAARDQQRLDSGAVVAKEMESLQSEIASLGRRQTTLEDEELEILERREQAETAAAQAQRRIDELEARRSASVEERDRELAVIDAEEAGVAARRADVVPALPGDLLALYERLRADRGGVGAAALVRRRCEGCHLELAGNDLTEVRAAAPDEVLRHEDCGRILVRTAESGL